jgi:hypothetical protein
VQIAQRHVLALTEAVEQDLLNGFDEALNEYMENTEDAKLAEVARELVRWLHLFNNGQSLQKKYIFNVIEKRMPREAGGGKSKKAKKQGGWGIFDAMRGKTAAVGDDDDDDSSAGEDGAPVNSLFRFAHVHICANDQRRRLTIPTTAVLIQHFPYR